MAESASATLRKAFTKAPFVLFVEKVERAVTWLGIVTCEGYDDLAVRRRLHSQRAECAVALSCSTMRALSIISFALLRCLPNYLFDSNTGIYHWMAASTSRCKHLSLDAAFGSCMKIPTPQLSASSVGCRLGDAAAGEAERDHAIVAHLGEPTFGIPPRSRTA